MISNEKNSMDELHDQAMELADQAFIAKRRGDLAAAQELYHRAFRLEAQAADLVKDDLSAEPTRSVLYRSAAAMAIDAMELEDARRLIDEALSGSPPKEIEQELLALEQYSKQAQVDSLNKANDIHSVPYVGIISTSGDELTVPLRALIASDRVRVVGIARRWDEVPHLMSSEPDVVLFYMGTDVMRTDASQVNSTIDDILARAPNIRLFLTGPDMGGPPMHLVKPMQADARRPMHNPDSGERLLTTIEEIFHDKMMRLQQIDAQTSLEASEERTPAQVDAQADLKPKSTSSPSSPKQRRRNSKSTAFEVNT
ncbi:MAG: hypothetical protein WCD37_09330 [Chloroflexia bacterium]